MRINAENPKRILLKKSRSKFFLERAIALSLRDNWKTLRDLADKPTASGVAKLTKKLGLSGIWIGHSAVRHALSTIAADKAWEMKMTPEMEYLINAISEDREVSYKKATYKDIFTAIYLDRTQSFINPERDIKLKCPPINSTLVLVSGVFNEIFSTAAFERGAQHLKEKGIADYISPRVYGTKSVAHNCKLLEEQIFSYTRENPDKKLWFLAFSKGGLDCLHFMRRNPAFCNEKVSGLSTIATPILGSTHTEHRALRALNKLHNFSNSRPYKLLDEKVDVLFKEFQRSLSSDYQEGWFKANSAELPKNPFYTALALESEWWESHFWMMLTKALFRPQNINDGIVDADRALFPHYFQGMNLGIIKGHHLIGNRSSYFLQEALLEAHIIFLKHQGMEI
jgi:hypothetical protein